VPVRSLTGSVIVNVPGFGLSVAVAADPVAADPVAAEDGAADGGTAGTALGVAVATTACCDAAGEPEGVATLEEQAATTRRTIAPVADRPSILVLETRIGRSLLAAAGHGPDPHPREAYARNRFRQWQISRCSRSHMPVSRPSRALLLLIAALAIWSMLSYAFITIFPRVGLCSLLQPVVAGETPHPMTQAEMDARVAGCNRPSPGMLGISGLGYVLILGAAAATWPRATKPGNTT